MKKKEIIWREILHQAVENRQTEFTQKELAQKYGFSLSTVFQALKIPQQSGVVIKGSRGFRVQDIEKFLYLWATVRNLKKDIIYETHVPRGVKEVEGEMPPSVVFGVFSAYTKSYTDVPADYDKVYVYLPRDEVVELEKRFPPQEGYANVIVLEADPWLEDFGKITPSVQTFADLWNTSEWYAKDFLNALKMKLGV